MATENKRLALPQSMVTNGIDAGGLMMVNIRAGFDQINKSAPDGLEVSLKDKSIQYVRGSVITQDWIHAIELLTGTATTLAFSERKSAVAAAAGYVDHVINLPVIHMIALQISRNGFATVAYEFECRAADETAGIVDMWATTDSQAAPDYVSAARGGTRIISATHGTLSILHSTDLTFSITLPLVKESNDTDIGYTCVDARTDGLNCKGSISFQDGSIKAATTQQLIAQLITAAKGDLAVTVKQSQSAANKVITIAGVDFDTVASSSSVNSKFSGYTGEFDVANDETTPLTIAGANKIITIADAA